MTASPDVADAAGPLASDPVALDGLVRRLALEFPAIDEQEIADLVRAVADDYRDVRVTQFVAIFVERQSRRRLRALPLPVPLPVPLPRYDDRGGH